MTEPAAARVADLAAERDRLEALAHVKRRGGDVADERRRAVSAVAEGGLREDEPMKITALAPWFGGKRTLASEIIRQLGPHRTYWEPFCGSMAVLLAKPACSMETVNDLHGDLVNLSRVIQDDRLGPALYRRLRRVLASQEEMVAARERLRNAEKPEVGELSLFRAEAYFVNSWLSMNGTAGTYGSGEQKGDTPTRRGIARRFSSQGGAPATRFAAGVSSIPAWRRRLRTVFILRDDGIELCDKIEDRDGTVIYADPPYLVKGEKYVHDFTPADHERLAAALRRFRSTRVVVSYYAHPDLDALYPGWTVVASETTKAMVNSGKRVSEAAPVKAPEVLLINGPPAETADLFGGQP